MNSENEISFKDFQKVDIRIGEIIKVENFPEAQKPSYKVWVDFGDGNIKKSSAQIANYGKDELMHRQIIAVTNFGKKQIGKFMSEILILGVPSPSGVILLVPEKEVELGVRVY
ncbi:MAG: tRNA-binding protein [Candidatus Hodarchaeales archaeon]